MSQLIVTFKVSREMLRVLDEYARRHGLTRSEVIREAIAEYLRRRGYRRLPPALSPVPKHDRRALVVEVDV